MKKFYWITILLTLALAGFAVSKGLAQAPTPSDDQVNAIARQLYCPVCENIPLDVCPTQACAQWRALIRQMLAKGKSPDDIKQYFVQQYGDRVLATPPAHGLNWLAYIIPPAAIILGAYILFRAFQAWKKPQPQSNLPAFPGDDQPPDEYIARLEEEVRKP
jgi:cytochrome c-type biogenesis protein CcmH